MALYKDAGSRGSCFEIGDEKLLELAHKIQNERSKDEARQALGICVQSLQHTKDSLHIPMPHYVKVSVRRYGVFLVLMPHGIRFPCIRRLQTISLHSLLSGRSTQMHESSRVKASCRVPFQLKFWAS